MESDYSRLSSIGRIGPRAIFCFTRTLPVASSRVDHSWRESPRTVSPNRARRNEKEQRSINNPTRPTRAAATMALHTAQSNADRWCSQLVQ